MLGTKPWKATLTKPIGSKIGWACDTLEDLLEAIKHDDQ